MVQMEMNSQSSQGPSLTDGQTPKRVHKSSGCKLPYDVHTWGTPDPYQTGPTNAKDHADGLKVDEEDKEALLKQLKQLNLTEQVMEKASWIKELVELQQDPPLIQTMALRASSLATTTVPLLPLTTIPLATRASRVTLLDTLLAGYLTGAAPQVRSK